MDAEAVLLVDHREGKVGERDLGLEQGVGPDHDPGAAARQIRQQPGAPGAALAAGEQRGREPGGRQQPGERRLMLARQDLGRRHDRSLAAGLDRGEHREHGDERLAAADVALEQPQHARRPRHVGLDRRQHLPLPGGQAERQGVEQRPAQPAIAHQHPPRLLRGRAPHQRQRQLIGQQLVEGEALAGGRLGRDVGGAGRPMQAPQRVAEARPAALREPRRVLPFGELRQILERLPGEPAEDAQAQALGQRVDRLHPARERELGGRQDQLGVHDLPVPPVARERAADHALAAFGQGLAQVRLAGAEEDQVQPARGARAAHAIGRAKPTAAAAPQARRRMVLPDHDRERHALACDRAGGAAGQAALDRGLRQMPEQVEPARGDTVGQAEQPVQRGLETRPDPLQRARGREQRGERSVRRLRGRRSARMRGQRRAARRIAAGLCNPVRRGYILGHRSVGNPRDSRSARMSEPIAIRRKRLVHQSRYRGRLEGDLLLGRFAERHLAELDRVQLDRYEALLGESDQDLLAWISGQAPVPARHDHDVFRLLRTFEFVTPAE